MDTGQIVAIVFAGLFIVAGLAGSFIPFLPGTPLIFVGALIYGISTDFAEITAGVLIALGVFAAIASFFNYFASGIGAKKFGSSNWGVVGAILGVIVGVFFGGLIGLLIFPFLFAFLFELIAGASAKKSLKAGLGSVLGVLGSAIMQFVFGMAMVITFLIALF